MKRKHLNAREKKWLDPRLGVVPDGVLADQLSDRREIPVTKSCIQRYRTKQGVAPFHNARGGSTKESWAKTIRAQERGYSSHLVEALWEENRLIEGLMYTWKRSPALRALVEEIQCS